MPSQSARFAAEVRYQTLDRLPIAGPSQAGDLGWQVLERDDARSRCSCQSSEHVPSRHGRIAACIIAAWVRRHRSPGAMAIVKGQHLETEGIDGCGVPDGPG